MAGRSVRRLGWQRSSQRHRRECRTQFGRAQCADGKQAIALAAVGFDVTRKHLVETEIIRHAGEVPDVADGLGREPGEVTPEPAGPSVPRRSACIAHGTTVAAGVDPATLLEGVDQQGRRMLDGCHGIFFLGQTGQRLRGLQQRQLDVELRGRLVLSGQGHVCRAGCPAEHCRAAVASHCRPPAGWRPCPQTPPSTWLRTRTRPAPGRRS